MSGSRPGLGRGDRRFLALLGMPALGLTFAFTVVGTYLPVLVEASSGPIVVGLLVGAEGMLGLWVPTVVGAASDRRSSTVGDRMRWLWPAAGVVMAALLLAALAGGLGPARHGWVLGALVVAVAVTYAGYYGYLASYWALYPDLVPREQSGRSRSAESIWRITGTGLALIGGGFLFSVWVGLPFLVGAVLVGALTAALTMGLRDRADTPVKQDATDVSGSFAAVRDLLRIAPVRRLVVAIALWNGVLVTLTGFTVLFFTVGLGRSETFVSGVIFPLVAVGMAAGAPSSGWLADRFGHVRVLRVALVVYGVGLAAPGFSQNPFIVLAIPLVAWGAATVMTLPWAMLMQVIPAEHHGAGSGLFGFARGLGSSVGPLTVGIVVSLTGGLFPATHGYAAMWLVISAAILISLAVVNGLELPEDQDGDAAGDADRDGGGRSKAGLAGDGSGSPTGEADPADGVDRTALLGHRR